MERWSRDGGGGSGVLDVGDSCSGGGGGGCRSNTSTGSKENGKKKWGALHIRLCKYV